jgi:predicted dehydrogenase
MEVKMRDEPVSLGIVGCGLMGGVFAVAAMGMPNVVVASVVDADAARASELASRLGCRAMTNVQQMLDLSDVDGIIIATPETDHVEPAVQALMAGKYVLIEKPLADSVASAQVIVEAAEAQGAGIAVGHCLRLDPAYKEARQAVSSGRLGDVVHVAVHRNTSIADAERLRGRTSIVDYLGIHDIDVLEWVTNSHIVEAAAKGASLRMRDFGADDAVQVLMSLDNGAIGTLECSWLRPNEAMSEWGAGMAIWGTSGALQVTPYAAGLTVAADGKTAWSNQVYQTGSRLGGPLGGVYRDELANFIQFVNGEDAAACTGREGLRAVQVAAAIKTSVGQNGNWVKV